MGPKRTRKRQLNRRDRSEFDVRRVKHPTSMARMAPTISGNPCDPCLFATSAARGT
jgi:hypothetical protein